MFLRLVALTRPRLDLATSEHRLTDNPGRSTSYHRDRAADIRMSTLLQNGTVISWNDSTGSLEVLYNTSILITHYGKIAAIVKDATDLNLDDTTVIDVSDKILCPGFVSTHHHLVSFLESSTRREAFSYFVPSLFRRVDVR